MEELVGYQLAAVREVVGGNLIQCHSAQHISHVARRPWIELGNEMFQVVLLNLIELNIWFMYFQLFSFNNVK
jgi:hypothetical protein